MVYDDVYLCDLYPLIIKNVHLCFIKKKNKTSFTHTLSHYQQHEMQPDVPQVFSGHAFDSLGCPHLALVQV